MPGYWEWALYAAIAGFCFTAGAALFNGLLGLMVKGK